MGDEVRRGKVARPIKKRQEIVAACKLKPGMMFADVGAGTGLYTRLFAEAVGKEGTVYAVDISPKFLELPSQGKSARLPEHDTPDPAVLTDAQIRQIEADNIRAAHGKVSGPGGAAHSSA